MSKASDSLRGNSLTLNYSRLRYRASSNNKRKTLAAAAAKATLTILPTLDAPSPLSFIINCRFSRGNPSSGDDCHHNRRQTAASKANNRRAKKPTSNRLLAALHAAPLICYDWGMVEGRNGFLAGLQCVCISCLYSLNLSRSLH